MRAYDFSAVAPSGQTLYYNIVDGNAEVTSQIRYTFGDAGYSDIEGLLVIPSTVTWEGVTYMVTTIGDFAFFRCWNLTSVTIPNSVTSIGQWAFWRCYGLTSVALGNSVITIGGSAFEECTLLTSVTIPNSVTSIGWGAFSNCSSLTSVSIPNSVTTIGGIAFSNCTSLTSVNIGSSVTYIGSQAFSSCTRLSSIIVNANNTHYDSRNNSNAIIEANTKTLIVGCQNTIIPNSVAIIGEHAFRGCRSLRSITIPDSVRTIEEGAFYGCSGLTSMTFHKWMNYIRRYAFSGCTGLTSIFSLNEYPPIISSNAFEDVDKSIPLYVPANSVGNYSSAEGWRAFYHILPIQNNDIESIENNSVRCINGSILVSGMEGLPITICDLGGRMIVHEKVIDGKPYTMPHSGVFIIHVGNYPAQKVVVAR